MSPANQPQLGTHSRFSFSAHELFKLLTVVAALGFAYAIASSRIAILERSIQDGQHTITKIETGLAGVERKTNEIRMDQRELQHKIELRLKDVENRLDNLERRR